MRDFRRPSPPIEIKRQLVSRKVDQLLAAVNFVDSPVSSFTG
jgi:hypothetical protein